VPDANTAPEAPPFRGVVAIDGPSGSGKSTVARELAVLLRARYLDTGAMYRAVTWAALRAGIAPDDTDAVADLAERSRLVVSVDPQAPGIAVDGRPVDAEIRSPAVTSAVSAVSAIPAVRRVLVQQQRRLIGAGGIVAEGRDIATVVAPEAAVKVFLTASTGVRAGRRGAETGTTGPDGLAATAADLSRRDTLDSTRLLSPLALAADAVILDTSELGVAEVVARLLRLVEVASAGRPPRET
jgi:cytidylate kinase